MKIVLAGCTGFIGARLVRELALEGHEIVSLTRRPDRPDLFRAPNVRYAAWDGTDAAPVVPHLDGADAVVNLAGESIANVRWSEARKRVLAESRIGPTTAVVSAIAAASRRPKVLVNGSAVGYYGNVEEGEVTEASPPGEGFLAELCANWEAAARKASEHGVRVVLPRTGVVLGGKGGALDKMTPPFRFFVGGPIGTGRQWMPWIHLADVTGIVRFAIAREGLRGPVNAVAPDPVRMKDFCAALGAALGRPSWAPVPGFVVRIVAGEVASMVLGGQRAVPAALLAAGYRFRHPALAEALVDALHHD